MHLHQHGFGCLIRAEDLRPGDVFLTQGRTRECRLIAALSRGAGNYAHSGIIVDPQHLLEADDDGVGATYLPGVSLWRGGVLSRWVYVPWAPGTFVFLRHPRLAAGDQHRVAERVQRACKRFEGMPYAKWPALLEASRVSGLLKKVLRWYLGWRDPRRQDSPLEGVICSQLVVKVYRELGIELFDRDEVDQTISVNMLAGLDCLELVPLSDALDEAEARRLDPEVSFGKLFEEATSSRGQVKHLAAFNDSIATIGRMLRRQRQDLDDQRRETLASFEKLCEQTRQEMQQHLQPEVRLADPDHFDRVARWRRRFDELYPRARQYHARGDVQSRQPYVDAYYQLCLVVLYYQRHVTRRARRALRKQHAQARGLRGLFRRRSLRRRHRKLGRGLAHVRGAILWFLEQRKETATLFRA